MKRFNEDYILVTNNEAREIQRALHAGAEATSQLADLEIWRRKPLMKVVRRLRSWQKRIHDVWIVYKES